MRGGTHSRKHIRLTRLTEDLYFISVRMKAHPYLLASRLMEDLRKRRRRSPSIQSILKRIRILRERGYYETVGWRGTQPIIRPSPKFHLLMAAERLKRVKAYVDEISMELGRLISRIEELIKAYP